MKLHIFGMFFIYMRTYRLIGRRISFLIAFLLSSIALANPVGINISGRIVDDSSNTALSGPVSFRVKVLTNTNCILYSEEFNSYNIPSTGTFTFTLGKGSSPVNAYHVGNPVAAQSELGMNNIFSNAHTISVNTLGEGKAVNSPTAGDNVACGGAGVAYTPSADDIRKVRIEFDDGDGQGYKAILPYHQIRTVPYAMLAEEANNALKLGGAPAADYAKLTDLPDLTTAVPAAETDPSVKAFAKANISGLTAGSCAAGQVLSYNGTALVCVADAGGSSSPIATDTVVGTVMVPTASYVSLLGTGEIDVKDLPISKITNLQTALNSTLKVADMPASSCAAGEALIWSSPSNVFTCSAITIDSAHVSDFNTAVDARITAGNAGSPKLPLAGGTMTGDITMGSHDLLASGHITMSAQKTITVGKYDQTQENTLAGTLAPANEGATWYNSAMKSLRFWDGTARQTVVSTTAACSDGQLLKWNDTTKVWYCAADAGSGGADASSINGVAVNPVPAPSVSGQVLRFDSVSGKWVAAAIQAGDVPVLDAAKITTGTLPTARGGTGQTAYTDGQLLIGKTDGTLAKATLTAGTGITVTNGDGTITIDATATAPSDASYAAKGVVQLLTDAPTSGLNVAAGVISVNSGTAANQLVKLDGTAKLPAVDGSALTNVTVVADKVTSAAGKYLTYSPNNVACANGEILVKTANGWECGTQTASPGDASYAAKGVVQFNTDAATSGVSVAAGVATVNTGTAANQIIKLDGTAKLPAVDGSALTNITTVVDKITSAAGKYFGYKPNNVACADGEVLKWNNGATRWECGADAGAGGADASSIRGKSIAVSVGTPAAGSFLTYDNATTSWVASVFTDCTAAGSAIHYNATLNTWSCDALTVGSSNITDGSIVNADVSATAAIARTKLANGTAYRIVANDASGVMSDAAAITASRALISDANGIPTHSTVTTTELGYVSGVTSAIQTQIDGLSTSASGKVTKTGDTMTGNLVMNAQKEVRFADSDSSNFIGLKAPATVASDVTFTLPAADGTAGYVLKTDGAGALSWVAQTAAPVDASYAAKGIVQFNTDADTSGVTVAAGVATVNTGTAANQIVKLDSNAKLPAVDGSQLINIIQSLVPASSTILMASCPGGWTDNGAATSANCNGAACRMCQSPASPSSIPASTIIKMETCPAGWTGLGFDTGPTASGFDTLTFVNCQSPGSASKLPLNTRMIMPSCPAQWNDLGPTGPTGPLVATCSGVACRVCEVSGAQMPSHLVASTAGSVVLLAGAGGGTNLNGGAVNIYGGTGGVSNGNGGSVSITGGAPDGSGTAGNVLLAASIGKVGIGLGGGAPSYPLDVNGDINITGAFRINGTAIGGGSGTVTSVSSANADIGVSMASPTPVLTLNSGTGANQIVKLDGSSKLPAVDGSALTNLTASNLSGAVPVSKGGTGATSLAANRLVGMNGTGTVQQAVTCALNQVLSFDASGNYGCYAVSSIYSGFVNGGNTFGATSNLGNNDNFDLNIKTNNLNRLTVQAGGNVGIGTTTPAALLDVNGAITAASVTASSLSASNVYSAYLGLNGSNPNGLTMAIQNSAANGYSGVYFTDDGGAMQGAVGFSNSSAPLVPDAVFLASMGTKPLVLATNGAVERMRITSGGSVGIGTTSPNSGLQVTAAPSGWTVAGWPKNIQVGADGGAGLLRFPFNNSNQPAIGSSTDGILRFMHSGAIDASGALSTDMVIMPSGNVGIGTTNATSILHVQTSGSTIPTFYGGDASQNGLNFGVSSTNRWLAYQDTSANGRGFGIWQDHTGVGGSASSALYILTNGSVGIGTTSPSYTLHVNGSVAGTSAYNNLSDGRLKRNVANVPDALNKISEIRGVSFDWRKEEHPELRLGDRKELGVIAQEVEQVFPEAVSVDKNTGIRSVAYSMLIAPLIEATKELRHWLLNHDREIASLKEKNEQLEQKNKQMETYLCGKDPSAPFCK